MSTISAVTAPGLAPGLATQNQGPDAGKEEFSGSVEAMVRAMAEAQRITGESTMKENLDDMMLSMNRRQAYLQKKRDSVYAGCDKERDSVWWKSAGRIASAFLSLAAAGMSLGGVAGGGRQMNKAAAEGSLSNMSNFSQRGFKLDAWNKFGQSGQFVQQGLGGVAQTVGEQKSTSYEVDKKFQDIEGQMYDSDAAVLMDLIRRRGSDAMDAIKRAEKNNEARVEYLRAAMRTLG